MKITFSIKAIWLTLFLSIALFKLNAQSLAADSIIALQTPLHESSGIIHLNGTLITHGDSGNPNALFEIDTATGLPSRTVYISNATNIDWEDICADASYIYIGDFGNNLGSRQDLKIYKVAIADYFNAQNDTVFADTISFSYADQSSFTPAPWQTNYDAEGLVSHDDSLYVFTKQWSKAGTTIYSLPKSPGNYSIHKVDSILTMNIVTAADYNPANGLLSVVSHTSNYATLLLDYGWYPGKAASASRKGYSLFPKGSLQIEGVAIRNNRTLYFTSETGLLGDGVLSKSSTPLIGMVENEPKGIILYPNPTSGKIELNYTEDISAIYIYDVSGKQVGFEFEDEFLLIKEKGVFVVQLVLSDGAVIFERLIVY